MEWLFFGSGSNYVKCYLSSSLLFARFLYKVSLQFLSERYNIFIKKDLIDYRKKTLKSKYWVFWFDKISKKIDYK